MENAVQNIPKSLIYEMEEGRPIYYKGYKDHLDGKKQIEELMGSSYLQSFIITQIVGILLSELDPKYRVLTNELGLQFSKGSWRAADIAVFSKDQLQGITEDTKYISVPPQYVIEIDTKAEIEEVQDSFGYFHRKTDQLLAFGIEKVIWLFTDSKKVMIAEKNKEWKIMNWDQDFQVAQATINVKTIIEKM